MIARITHRKLEPLTRVDQPMDRALCVFRATNGTFFIGYIDARDQSKVHMFGFSTSIPPRLIASYQYVLNEHDGYILIPQTPQSP